MRDWRLTATWTLAMLMLVAMAAFMAASFWLPGDSAILIANTDTSSDPWIVSAPRPVPGGLRTGDVIIELDRRATEDWLRAGLRAPFTADPPGEALTYTVRRGTQVLTVVEPLARRPLLDDVRANWSYFLFMGLLQAVGSLLLLRRPALPASRALLLLSSAVTSSSVAFFLGLRPSDMRYGWLLLLYLWCSVLLFGLLAAGALHFTLVFPRVQPALSRRPWLLPVIYLGAWLPYGLTVAARWGQAPDLAARGHLLLSATNSMTAIYFSLIMLSAIRVYVQAPTALERRQLRWVVWGILGALLPWIALTVLPAQFGLPSFLPPAVVGLTWCLIPVTIAIAILREGLFDIDVIINRTLVYGALSGILVLIYFASVVLLQAAVGLFTGDTRTPLVTVLSTLAIAGLAAPLRAGLQTAIDRRFFRRKYDAARTLVAFGAAARNEVDLETLTERLLMVVDETLQPRQVGLWLAPSVTPPGAVSLSDKQRPRG